MRYHIDFRYGSNDSKRKRSPSDDDDLDNDLESDHLFDKIPRLGNPIVQSFMQSNSASDELPHHSAQSPSPPPSLPSVFDPSQNSQAAVSGKPIPKPTDELSHHSSQSPSPPPLSSAHYPSNPNPETSNAPIKPIPKPKTSGAPGKPNLKPETSDVPPPISLGRSFQQIRFPSSQISSPSSSSSSSREYVEMEDSPKSSPQNSAALLPSSSPGESAASSQYNDSKMNVNNLKLD